MRLKYSDDTQPNDGTWTMANLGNTGEVLAAAIALGAKTDYMDEAVWNPVPRPELAGIQPQRGPAVGPHHLCQQGGPTLLQRVELLRRGHQGDVRQ